MNENRSVSITVAITPGLDQALRQRAFDTRKSLSLVAYEAMIESMKVPATQTGPATSAPPPPPRPTLGIATGEQG